MDDREIIMQYIKNSQECEWVDFKEKFYILKHNKGDLIKDIVSFANNPQAKDKYIIFGVEDKSHNICGINSDILPDIADLENLLYEKVEPQITIMLDSFGIDNNLIAYIKIPCSNENRPYIIKNECGSVKQGDIYIRKGSVNTRVTRRDLDDIYSKRQIQQITPYGDCIIIEPIHMKDSLLNNPTYGRMDVEIINLSNTPLLINNGWIEFENTFGRIERRILDILPNRDISENPFEVVTNSHSVKTVLFDFLSVDCITLHFDDEGKLLTETYASTFFEDVNGKVFKSEPRDFYIIAKGDILHKIKLVYKKFRLYLKKNRISIMQAIELSKDDQLNQLLSVSCIDFSLLQPGYVLGNPEFPEYDICADMIHKANNKKNNNVIELMQMKGLPKDFIEFALHSDKDL